MLAWQGAQELEIACDQAVIHGLDTETKRQYGQCILNHAAHRIGHQPYRFTAQLTGGKKAMKVRLQALFMPPKKQRGIAFLLVVLFAGSMVGCSFAVGTGNQLDAETVQQMNQLAQQWCDAQKNQLTPAQAKMLLGGSLKKDFENMVYSADDVQPETRFPVDNLPMDAQPDTVSYTLDPKTYTAVVKIHTNDTQYGGMTQVETIQFGKKGEALRIIDRTIDEVMQLDHPEEICTTAQDILDRGMPENPVDASTPQALVYLNFPVAGGRYEVYGGNLNLVIYTFADNTAVFFEFERITYEQYRLKALSAPPAHESSIVRDKNEVDMLKAGRQWAEGYRREDLTFSYPFMSKAMQQACIRAQQAVYGMAGGWKMGWDSSPSIEDYHIKIEAKDRIRITYFLYPEGEETRYAERLMFTMEDGQFVIAGREEAANGKYDKPLGREEFLTLYETSELLPPSIDEGRLNMWKKFAPERYAEMQTPEGALREMIRNIGWNQYPIKRVTDELPWEDGVRVDLAVTLSEKEPPVSITMYRETNTKYWTIDRIEGGEPDHRI